MSFDSILLDRISKEADVGSRQTEATIGLLEQQATVPFIARYRKEVTGNLDEVQIRTISERLDYYKELLERRSTILKSIEEQGKLSEDLKAKILSCHEKAELEDLYLPYKPKRKTKAGAAIEKGLEPLARFIYDQVAGERSIDELAETFINVDKQITTKEEALEGALHIVAEWISENLEIRRRIREALLRDGVVAAKVNKDKTGQKTKYEMYYDFREPVSKIPSHRMLAVRRGVKEQVLSFSIEIDSEKTQRLISEHVVRDPQSPFASSLQAAVKDSYERLLSPSLQSEVRALLKDRSDAEAIRVFEANLSNLLLSPPAGLIGVMGIDPGFRTGCKVAVVDETGKFLEHTTIFPTEPRKDIVGSERKLYRLIQKHKVKAVTIGNGTGSRETDSFVKDFVRKYQSGDPLGVASPEDKKSAEPAPVAASGAAEELAPKAGTERASSETASLEGGGFTQSPRERVADVVGSTESVAAVSATGAGSVLPAPAEEATADAGPVASVEGALPSFAVIPLETSTSSALEVLQGDTDVVDPVKAVAAAETASVAAETVVAPAAEERPQPVEERHPIFTVIINESGASVYSASESARQEFPKLDLTVRGAISIARRLQDPLAELVKIHPKSIGVGQYQHDVDQKRLKAGLEASVESCVNRVGVDLNTASYELLRYCSGVNQKLAKSIVNFRDQHGKFTSRAQLLQVPGFGDKTFEQAAGFLRIKGGENPLDATAVHPESYPVVEKMAASLAKPVGELIENSSVVNSLDLSKFADEKTGLFTLADIKQELLKPGRDPRHKFVVPTFRDDVKEVSDLKVAMELEGTVTNVTNFGAFVDIGVHQDGLVHVSEISNRFIQDPREAVHVGEIVKVKVIGVDTALKRISLSMKALLPEHKKAKPERRDGRAQRTRPAQTAKPAQAGAAVAARVSAPAARQPFVPQVRDKGMQQRRPKSGDAGPRPAAKPHARAPVKHVAQAAAPAKRPELPKKPEPPAPAALSFEEKIRLLQEKFGGIR